MLMQAITAHDNPFSCQYFAQMHFGISSTLNGLHIIENEEALGLVLLKDGEQDNVAIVAAGFNSDDDLSWYWQKEAAPVEECVTVASINPSLPPYWRNPGLNYWFEYLEPDRTVYCAFNMTLNADRESFADFNLRLWNQIKSLDPQRLVIDLRHNLGGDRDILPALYESMLEHPRINQHGKLFLLIGAKNVSASSHCVAWFERQSHAILVGEPTGARVNQYADPEHLRLPNSQLRLMIPRRFWENSASDDTRQWIPPHHCAGFRSADYFGLNDPVLKLALQFA